MTKDFEDSKFLEQISKEFPIANDNSPRTSSFSLNSKIAKQEKETKISTAFNRKLSLQLTPEMRRNSLSRENKLNHRISDSGSSVTSDCCVLSSGFGEEISLDGRINIHKCGKAKCGSEKSSSPPVSTVGSGDGESGFSSMNSFHENGLPLANSTLIEDYKGTPSSGQSIYNRNQQTHNMDSKIQPSIEDIKLWQRSEQVSHKRWSSTPAETIPDPQSLKVLWV